MFIPFVLLLFQYNDTILLLKRGNVSFGKGFYSLPGGKIDGNETARHAACREAYEELGVIIAENDLEFMHIFHRKGNTEEIFALVFLVKQWDGECFNKEPEKHDDLRWCPLNALPTLLPAHLQAIQLIQKNIQYSEHGWPTL